MRPRRLALLICFIVPGLAFGHVIGWDFSGGLPILAANYLFVAAPQIAWAVVGLITNASQRVWHAVFGAATFSITVVALMIAGAPHAEDGWLHYFLLAPTLMVVVGLAAKSTAGLHWSRTLAACLLGTALVVAGWQFTLRVEPEPANVADSAPPVGPSPEQLSFALAGATSASSEWFEVERTRTFAIVLDVQGPLTGSLPCELALSDPGRSCASEPPADLHWELLSGDTAVVTGALADSRLPARIGQRIYREIGRFRVEPGRRYRVTVTMGSGDRLRRSTPVIGFEAIQSTV